MEDSYYTAWDGRQYPGEPPAGWFLAADNRWWPTSDLIDPPSSSPELDPGFEQPAPAPSPAFPPPDPPQPYREVPSGGIGDGGAPSAGRPPNRRGGTRRPGRRRSGRPPIGMIIFIIFFLSRCVDIGAVFPDTESDSGTAPATTISGEPSRPPPGAVEAIPGTFRATAETCEGGFVVGTISNLTAEGVTFVVEATVPDGFERRSDPVSLDGFESAEWQIEAPVFGQLPCELSTVYIGE